MSLTTSQVENYRMILHWKILKQIDLSWDSFLKVTEMHPSVINNTSTFLKDNKMND